MRHSSTIFLSISAFFFILLLQPSSLAAQSLDGNDAAAQIDPALHQACPVGFSVDRKYEGAVVWTGSENDWVRSHRGLSLPELERSFQNQPDFSKLSAQAQQDSLARLIQIYYANRPGPHGLGLDIRFNKPGMQIVSVDVEVHGYPAMERIIPATPSAPNEITESFHLTRSDGQPLQQSSIWTRSVMFVNRVALTRLEYADGTVWRAPSPSICIAVPSLYVPVALAQ